jgi:hypothetical protein
MSPGGELSNCTALEVGVDPGARVEVSAREPCPGVDEVDEPTFDASFEPELLHAAIVSAHAGQRHNTTMRRRSTVHAP